jgi:hypothetical protein
MDDGDQYFKKKTNFMSKNFHNATCQILINRWQNLMTSTWHHGCIYNGVA